MLKLIKGMLSIMENTELGITIRNLRINKKITITELAKRVNYSRTYISILESGQINATNEIYQTIFSVLGVEYISM